MSDVDQPTERGLLDVVARPADDTEPDDLFAAEERPPRRLVLVVMIEDDAPDLVAALEAQGIGARLGELTDDRGVEILIHDTRLAEAEAVLVEFTGDPSLVDYVVPDDSDGTVGRTTNEWADDLVSVARLTASDAARQAERLRDAGIDVRLELPSADALQEDPSAPVSVKVARDDIEAARGILSIEF